jgi:putative membrane protein
MANAKKHYSSLFSLPSYKQSLIYSAAICVAGAGLTTYVMSNSIISLVLGVFFFAVTVFADLFISLMVLKDDPIFILRRTSAVSLVGWLIWLVFMTLGTVMGAFFDMVLWVKFVLFGFAAILTLRALVIMATSESAVWRQVLAVLLQPILCIVALLVFWASISIVLSLRFLPFIILAPIISFIAVYLFLRSIDRLGKTYGLLSMPLFKAFLLNWATDLNVPLEKHLEAMGENADIDVSLLKFDSSKPQAAIIVPQVHPGPFKNIGSSLLPSMLKSRFEKEFGGAACTPLGILGHELDLVSQAQNQRIVNQVLASAKFPALHATASPFVRATDGFATASGQIFGDIVFLSFTLAPKTTEDMPQELGRLVNEEAKKYGLEHAVVVNAHNCLDVVVDTEKYVEELKRAAIKCLQQATQQPIKPFKVGAATVVPKEFTLKQGMGTGGITAITIEVEKQKTAYIIIDGNNMVPHLREKILAALATWGFANSEVFTTDSHAVSALSTGSRGYHPIGEVINHDALIKHIKKAAEKAVANLEDAKAGYTQFVVPQVRVIGEERLDAVSTLVDKAIEQAKKTAPLIFGIESLLFVLLVLLF